MFRHDAMQGNGASNGDSFGVHAHGARTLASLPPLASLTSNATTMTHIGNSSWTRRSKSSTQSDESFSAYLHNPSSSSPALDRMLDKTRYSAQRGLPGAGGIRDYGPLGAPPPHHRRMPSLDAVGYAQERSTPYYVRPTPQRFSIRDVLSMHEHDRSTMRAANYTSPWRDSDEARLRQHNMEALYASPYAPRVPPRPDDVVEELGSDESFERIDADDAVEDTSGMREDSSFADEAEKKRRRRRTNKDEANVLAAVFDKTAFPDISTREALASRLDMSLRSVSIWFQNRRQAMKKRASRFGGVEGVRGASVAGAKIDDDDDDDDDDDECAETKRALKPWLSLDEVATRIRDESPDENLVQEVEPSFDMLQAAQSPAQRTSSAPLLDLLRKRRGHRSLERIASMPCIAAVLGNDARSASVAEASTFVKPAAKDLRRVLDDIDVGSASQQVRTPSAGLVRSASMTALPTVSQIHDEHSSTLSNDLAIFVNTIERTKIDGRECLPAPLDVVSHPHATLAKPMQHGEIWKRMKSSSSGVSSETTTPESDKENKAIAAFNKVDDFEDEEKTLRRIAQRRALKREQKVLSAEGSRYVIEADARLALQNKAKPTVVRQPLAPLPRVSGGAIVPPPPPSRAFGRSRSEGNALCRGGLARVTSLDFEAGRDRSKEVERPTVALHSLSQILRASRLSKSRANAQADRRHRRRSTNEGEGRQEGTRNATRVRVRHSTSTMVNSVKRTLEPTLSAPTISNDILPVTLRRSSCAQRQSSAESSLDLSLDSRASSEGGGSEEWLEQWARDQVRSSSHAVKRKSPEQAPFGERRLASAGAHDDSGFFGSDEASDRENDDDDGEVVRKRRSIASGKSDKSRRPPLGPLRTASVNASPPSYNKAPPLASSSPYKRGDERDRLAAETLLAFGSRA